MIISSISTQYYNDNVVKNGSELSVPRLLKCSTVKYHCSIINPRRLSQVIDNINNTMYTV